LLKAESLFTLRIGNRLFLALALLMFQSVISDILPKSLKGVLKLSGKRSYSFDVPVTPPKIETSSNGEPGLLVAVLLTFAGGVILKLVPCVFPVLFLKALVVAVSQPTSCSPATRMAVATFCRSC
jgi:hypothetical protein